MTDPTTTQRTLHLITEGVLPGWLGVLLAAAAGGFVLVQLRLEFAALPRNALRRAVLPGLRLLFVGLVIALLCRPALKIVSVRRERPALLAVVDAGPTMRAQATFASPYRKIDVLEHLAGAPIEKRRREGTDLVHALDKPGRELNGLVDAVRGRMADMDKGLPLAPDTTADIEALATSLPEWFDPCRTIHLPPSLPNADDALSRQLTDTAAAKRLLESMVSALAADADVVAREAAEHLGLLTDYMERVAETMAQTARVRDQAADLQNMLDAARVPPAELKTMQTLAVTRTELAGRSATRLTQDAERHYAGRQEEASSLSEAIQKVFLAHLASPLSAALVISDAAGVDAELDGQAMEALERMRVPVHTMLVGPDGVAPPDAGLLAVDMSSVAVLGRDTPVRVLVKNDGPGRRPAQVEITDSGRRLAVCPMPAESNGCHVLELSVAFDRQGTRQLVLEAQPERTDSYPGNERAVRTVHVLPNPARVLLVADGIRNDVAVLRAALGDLAFVDASVLLSAPEVSTIKVGTEDDEFPGTVENWEGVSLAILVGRVPPELLTPDTPGVPSPALVALGQAISNGLHVCVLDAASSGATPRWAEALGIAAVTRPPPRKLRPHPGLWAPFCELGQDEPESMHRWRRLPAQPGCRVLDTPSAMPVLETDDGVVVGLLPRDRGLILYCGIPDLTALRGIGSTAVANRLVSSLVSLALTPPAGGAAAAPATSWVFPPQPVLGKRLWLRDPTGQPTGLEGLAPIQGARNVFTVTGTNTAAFALGGAELRLLVHTPLTRRHFDLAPRALPLQAIAARTGGRFMKLANLARLPPLQPAATPPELVQTKTVSPWDGWWPLPLIVACVAAEYLLRRRAGRVM